MHKGHHHAYTSRDDMIAAGKYRKVGLELCFFAGEIVRTVKEDDVAWNPFFVVSAKGYVTAQASCTIQWLTETAGADGPIYSAHMRCSNPAAPEETMEVNRIIMPKDPGELSAGPDFRQLKLYRRCPSN